MDQDINVRSLRAALGLTQEQLGKAVGVDQSTVSNWENGASPSGPARKLLQSLAASVEAGQESAA
jgi:DNA-binding transcriptional regulator YiaG